MQSIEKSNISQQIDEKVGMENLFSKIGLQQVSRLGDRITSVCPFHQGADNPTAFSFKVSQGYGYCYTRCHKNYDIFNIIMTANNCDFMEAVEYVSDIIGTDISYKNKNFYNSDNLNFLRQVRQVRSKKKDKGIITFDKSILDSFIPKLHTLLRQEGFDDETREYFNLGFSLEGYFENRITIPVDNPDGSILTVSGRSIKSAEDIEMENIQKYLLYYGIDKTQTLYNISRAEPYIDLLREIIVVEGFKSVWRLHQYGADNVVATMGSSLSENQANILLKTGAKIITCGDNDLAGRELNQKVIERTRKYADVSYIDMSMINIPETWSPAELKKEQWEYLHKNRKVIT